MSLMDLSTVNEMLKEKYSGFVTLRESDKENKKEQLDLDKLYVFKVSSPKPTRPYSKEFTLILKDMLYRNYYWIDSAYRRQAIYDYIIGGCYDVWKKNEIKFEINIDNNTFNFIPDYYNETNKTFYHYFDKSYYMDTECCKKCKLLEKIEELFENSEEYNMIMITNKNCSLDYDGGI